MTILSIDIGGTEGTGVVVYDQLTKKIILSETFTTRDKAAGVQDFFYQVSSYVQRYRPSTMLVPIPTAHFSTSKRHHQKIGTLMVIGAAFYIEMVSVVDSNCKKILFGDGAVDKEFIATAFKKHKKLKTEHERDCFMFVKAYESGELKIQEN